MSDYENEIASYLERANTSLQVARELFDRDYYDVSASRAYYAAFSAAMLHALYNCLPDRMLQQ